MTHSQPIQCLKSMIQALIRVEDRLAENLHRYPTLAADSQQAIEIENQTAALFVDLITARNHVMSEAERQEVLPDKLDAMYEDELRSGPVEFPSLADDHDSPPGRAGWRQAASAGRASAQLVLAELLLGTLGHEANIAEGVKWLRKAADQQVAAAMYTLSDLLVSGMGVPRNVNGGVAMLHKAAELGMAEAQFGLSFLYAGGQLVPPSLQDAVRWLEKAAVAGHAEAQLALGMIHATGRPGRVDHATAAKWLKQAAANHCYAAIEWLENYGEMSPEDYQSAIYLESWSPDNVPPPQRASLLGVLISLGLVALLVVAAFKGNSLGLSLILLFIGVLFHEAGHFLGGKLVGIPILAFTVGAGPLLKSFYQRGKRFVTRFELRLLPVLGYVQPYVVPRGIWHHWQRQFRAKQAGEPVPALPRFDTSEQPQPVVKFVSRPRRMVYYLSGLAVNFCLAVLCLWAYENISQEGRLVTSPTAGRVPAGSVAQRAGIREGDRFLSVAGEPVVGFFDVQRRLAPMDRYGVGKALKDPPGTEIPLVVLRQGQQLTLNWQTPPAPPGQHAQVAFGLLPPESWRVQRVHECAAGVLKPGDAITGFQYAGHLQSTKPPDSHGLLRRAFAEAEGQPVALVIQRDGRLQTVHISPRPSGVGATAAGLADAELEALPFELERSREPGLGTGVGEIVARVLRAGASILVDLPRDVLRSITNKPTEEQKGWLLAEVKQDPWNFVKAFAVLNIGLLYFNLLPIPPLDGYHASSCLVSMAIRRDLPRRGEMILLTLGWLLILAWLGLNVLLMLRDAMSTVF